MLKAWTAEYMKRNKECLEMVAELKVPYRVKINKDTA